MTFVLAACNLIVEDGAVLLVRETKASARGRLNLPAGRVEPGETVIDAAVREAREETGLEVEAVAVVGIYHCPMTSEGFPVINVVFESRRVGGAIATSPEHPEVRFVPFAQVAQLADAGMLRGTHIAAAVAAFETGRRWPVDVVEVVPPSPLPPG